MKQESMEFYSRLPSTLLGFQGDFVGEVEVWFSENHDRYWAYHLAKSFMASIPAKKACLQVICPKSWCFTAPSHTDIYIYRYIDIQYIYVCTRIVAHSSALKGLHKETIPAKFLLVTLPESVGKSRPEWRFLLLVRSSNQPLMPHFHQIKPPFSASRSPIFRQ